MPPISSRLNLKNLENSDQSNDSTSGAKSLSTGSSDTEMKNSSIPIQRNDNINDDKESSNDASNETSDLDKSLVSHNRQHNTQPPLSRPETGFEGHDDHQIDQTENTSPTDDTAGTDSSATIPKRFFCSTCNQGFTRKHNMVSHELIHLSLKPHVCTLCSISFRRIHDLKRHEKLHTGEKPFHCEKCNRRFARTDALTRHLNSPNACTGKIKEEESSLVSVSSGSVKLDEPETMTIKPPTSSSSSSNSVISADMSGKTTSATDASLGRLSSELPRKNTEQHMVAAGSLSSDSLGGISDTINKANYDVHRWRAYQHQQQNSQKHGAKYPYNTTTTTTTTTVTTENEHTDESGRRRSSHHDHANEQAGQMTAQYPETQGQHYHHHYHHHHHHSDERSNRNKPAGLASWSIPSDREIHHDGQFRKHDEFYPKDIRASRKEIDGNSSSREFRASPSLAPHGNYSPRPGFDAGMPSSEQFNTSNMQPSFSDGGRGPQPVFGDNFGRSPLAKWPSQPEHKFPISMENQRPPIARFVSMEKYADLLNYTNDLQASLSRMDGRIKMLENAEHERGETEQGSHKRRKSNNEG